MTVWRCDHLPRPLTCPSLSSFYGSIPLALPSYLSALTYSSHSLLRCTPWPSSCTTPVPFTFLLLLYSLSTSFPSTEFTISFPFFILYIFPFSLLLLVLTLSSLFFPCTFYLPFIPLRTPKSVSQAPNALTLRLTAPPPPSPSLSLSLMIPIHLRFYTHPLLPLPTPPMFFHPCLPLSHF